MYGLYGLKHHTVEISGDVTNAGRTNERRQTREDNATQPLEAGRLSFAKTLQHCKKPVLNKKIFSFSCHTVTMALLKNGTKSPFES